MQSLVAENATLFRFRISGGKLSHLTASQYRLAEHDLKWAAPHKQARRSDLGGSNNYVSKHRPYLLQIGIVMNRANGLFIHQEYSS